MKEENLIFDVGIAHQKKIRDQKAIEDCHNLFGKYWEGLDLDLNKAIVRPVDFNTAKKIIEQYE